MSDIEAAASAEWQVACGISGAFREPGENSGPQVGTGLLGTTRMLDHKKGFSHRLSH